MILTMKKNILTLIIALVVIVAPKFAAAQCNSLLESCAKSNPGSMAGYNLVDAAYDKLDSKGGKLKITMYAGSTYRFLACKEDAVPALVMALASGDGKIIATNLTEDEKGVYRMMEVNCTATAEYTLVLIPYNGQGCAGVIYAMKQ